jgi:hypothetical protein
MKYITKSVQSRPGLTQEEALATLQSHPQYKAGTIIKSIRPKQNRWVASLLEPKVAEFPPGDDDDDDDSEEVVEIEGPEESDDSDDDGDSEGGPPKPKPPFGDKEEGPEGPDELGEDKGELGELLGLLHAIAEKLGIGAPDEGLGLDEELPIDGPPAPPHKGPGRPPGPGGAPPGPKPGPGGTSQRPGLPPGANPLAGFASAIPSFTASSDEPMTVKEAKADLEKVYPGYKVKQMKRDQQGKLHALMSNR